MHWPRCCLLFVAEGTVGRSCGSCFACFLVGAAEQVDDDDDDGLYGLVFPCALVFLHPQFILDMCAALRARQNLIQICIGTVVYFTVRTVIRFVLPESLVKNWVVFGVVLSHCPV